MMNLKMNRFKRMKGCISFVKFLHFMNLDQINIHSPNRYGSDGFPWADWDYLRREADWIKSIPSAPELHFDVDPIG